MLISLQFRDNLTDALDPRILMYHYHETILHVPKDIEFSDSVHWANIDVSYPAGLRIFR